MTAQLNRRDVLGAGLTFAITLAADPLNLIGDANAATSLAPNAWLTIGIDGTITIVSPAAELGQGSLTALPLIIAEELDTDWSKVTVVGPPSWDAKTYGNPRYNNFLQTTSSFAIWGYFKHLRLVGAQARRVLLDAVAAKWSVPVAELTTEPSVVVHAASGRRIGYGEIVAFAVVPATLPKIEDKDLKPASAFRLIGKDVPRVEVPLKVTGAAQYGIDVQVPGMVYAALLQSPYYGGTPVEIDDSKARAVSSISDVVKLPQGVAVVGASVEATQAAKLLLKVKWSDAKGARHDSERALNEFTEIARDRRRDGIPFAKVGDAKAAMQTAATVFHSEVYRTRYVYHAQMEPLNATASVSVDGQSVEIWAGTQSPSALHHELAHALHVDEKNIKFHQFLLGGGYGRRSQVEVIIEAALISKAVGKPVKLIWSREDDFAAGKFRPMTAHYMEAGFDTDGKMIAWHHRVVAESVGNFMAAVAGRKAAPTDRIVMKGTPLPQYPVPNKLAEHVVEDRGTRLSPWRGVGVGHNAFAIESFLDEIAKAQGKDPLAFRLELSTGQPRVQHLLRVAAEMADWKRKRDSTGLGLAFMEKDETLAAGVAEVAVDRTTGKIKVLNVWCAIDAGIAVQPKNLAAQTEGSIVYGLGAVLRERIVIKDGRVQQANFTDYEIARMSDTPNIEVKVVSTDNPPTGAGEDGLPLLACAVGNAIAALTGVRLRELPFSPELVKGALNA